ncbi:unnamed protein product [Durusdinium trenchii]|uniref:Uncharacterized protein n=1 Tax=Durusdinium trenchii TaxID=1381693 RepID=A0ABP0M554_9DINO
MVCQGRRRQALCLLGLWSLYLRTEEQPGQTCFALAGAVSSRSRAKQANERSHSPSRFALAGAVRHGWRDPRVVQRPRPRIVRQIQTYDAFENMGNPFDVYATFFGLSVVMLVILFVFPFATNFGRTDDKEEEDVELLYEEVDDEEDDKEDLYEEEDETPDEKVKAVEKEVKKQATTASQVAP